MPADQRRQLTCKSANGETFLLTEIAGTLGEGNKQFTLPNGGIVNALLDGTYQISASGEILRPV